MPAAIWHSRCSTAIGDIGTPIVEQSIVKMVVETKLKLAKNIHKIEIEIMLVWKVMLYTPMYIYTTSILYINVYICK